MEKEKKRSKVLDEIEYRASVEGEEEIQGVDKMEYSASGEGEEEIQGIG